MQTTMDHTNAQKKNVQKNINKGSKNHQMDLTSEVSAYIIVIVLMLQK
jgi:hypothetical protein